MAIKFSELCPEINEVYEYIAAVSNIGELTIGRTRYTFLPESNTNSVLWLSTTRKGNAFVEYNKLKSRGLVDSTGLTKHEALVVKTVYAQTVAVFKQAMEFVKMHMQEYTKVLNTVNLLVTKLKLTSALQCSSKNAPNYITVSGVKLPLQKIDIVQNPYAAYIRRLESYADELKLSFRGMSKAKLRNLREAHASALTDNISYVKHIVKQVEIVLESLKDKTSVWFASVFKYTNNSIVGARLELKTILELNGITTDD